MKKILFVALMVMLPLVITGCGEKNIECSKIDGNKEGKMIATIKGNAIKKISIEEIQNYEDLSELDNDYNQANSNNYVYKLLRGIDSNVTKNGNSLKTVITIDLDKAGSTVVREFFDFIEFTPDVFISYAESEGYTCN